MRTRRDQPFEVGPPRILPRLAIHAALGFGTQIAFFSLDGPNGVSREGVGGRWRRVDVLEAGGVKSRQRCLEVDERVRTENRVSDGLPLHVSRRNHRRW